MRALRLALSFLTRLPGPEVAPGADAASWEQPLARSMVAAPIAGVAVAAAQIGALTLGSWLVTPEVGVVLALAAGWWMTRGFHLDGLSDCFDGLLCNGEPARRLEVMRDPHAGGLGAASIAIWILLRAAVLHATLAAGATAPALYAAAVLARAPLAAELRARPASPSRGLFGRLHPHVRPADAAAGLVLAALLAAPVATLYPARIALGVGLAGLTTAVWHRVWRRSVGGLTGDILGAGVELRELTLLLAFATPILSP